MDLRIERLKEEFVENTIENVTETTEAKVPENTKQNVVTESQKRKTIEETLSPLDLSINRFVIRGSFVNNQARQLVLNIKKYCDKEKETGSLLIPLKRVLDRTVAMTQLSRRTVQRICYDDRKAKLMEVSTNENDHSMSSSEDELTDKKADKKRSKNSNKKATPAKKQKLITDSVTRTAPAKSTEVVKLELPNTDKTTSDGKTWNLKISSWNVAGLRAWVKKNGLDYIKQEDPDILCLQETKCPEDKLPGEVHLPGYHTHWVESEKEKGYAGVALYTKIKPTKVTKGLGIKDHDIEGRVITAEYDKFFLVTTYVPNSGAKLKTLDKRLKWNTDFHSYLSKLKESKPVILCGDLNVAHERIDIARPDTNNNSAGFTKQEREGFTELLSRGFIDSFRHLYPEVTGAYTFWTFMRNARASNIGWRLDYFVLSNDLLPSLCDCVIRKDVLGSDHCPVTLFLHI